MLALHLFLLIFLHVAIFYFCYPLIFLFLIDCFIYFLLFLLYGIFWDKNCCLSFHKSWLKFQCNLVVPLFSLSMTITSVKACVRYFLSFFLFFHQMIALQKLWKMFFISSKKLFFFSRYSNFCNFSPSFPNFPDSKGQREVE